MNSISQHFRMQNEYLELFTTNGLHWYIEDTRYTLLGNRLEKGTLDQIFSNNECIIGDVNLKAPLGKSDHACIEIEVKMKAEFDYINRKQRNWSKITKDFVSEKGENIDWNYSSKTSDVNEIWEELNGKIKSIIENIPEVIIKFSKQGDPLEKLPWDSNRLSRKRKEKDKAWRKFGIIPSMEYYQNAVSKQNEYETLEVKEKLKHENKIVRNIKYNCKPLFKYVKAKTKIQKSVSTVRDDETGDLTDTPVETAGVLASFFQSVHSFEEFGPLQESCYGEGTTKIMDELKIEPKDITLLLSKLDVSKSMGPDEIHPKILKYLSSNEGFINAITNLFRKCMEYEEIPYIWKTAIVIPLHKKGSIHLKSNYRPVSLTCILCKVFEKIIRNHILNFIKDDINCNQHGFVHGKSTLSNILESIDIINEYLMEEDSADIIYLDFSKAFDTVSHYRLLVKMKNVGITDKMVNIVREFLKDRTMKVKVGNNYSESQYIPSGVPQGSVLGPLLFLIFINDLPNNINSEIELFADDVKLLVRPLSKEITQMDLNKLSYWEDIWKLGFNLDKCKVLHVGSRNVGVEYVLNNREIKEVDGECDLGVGFDNTFKANNHILTIVSRANRMIGWMVRNIISRETNVVLRIYKALIRPHIEYCTQAWAPATRHGNWNVILKLEGVQRRVTKLISKVKECSYRERLDKLGLTTLLERRMRGDMIETFKIINGISNYGGHFFSISPRSGRLLSRQFSKTRSVNQLSFFAHRVICFWNKLPDRIIKNNNNVEQFKMRLDKFRESGRREKLMGHFWELSNEIFDRI